MPISSPFPRQHRQLNSTFCVVEGLTIKQAAEQLEVRESTLRTALVNANAITKTPFGWAANDELVRRNLLRCPTRQAQIITESGARIRRHYTVVLITGPGLAWLHNLIATTAHATQERS